MNLDNDSEEIAELNLAESNSTESDDDIRKSRIKLSIFASIVSKIFGVFLPLVTLPLAAYHLGKSYDAFMVLVNLGGLFTAINLGIGPAVVYKIAKYATSKDEDKERMLLASSFVSAMSSSLIVASIVILIGCFAPIELIFGKSFTPFEYVLRPGVFFLAFIVIMYALQGTAVNMYTGYMEVHKIRFTMAAGYLLSAVLAPLVIITTKSMFWTFVVIMGIPAVLPLTLIYRLLKVDRPYLNQSWKWFSKPEALSIFKGNMLQSVSDFGLMASRQLPVVAIGFIGISTLGAGQAGTFIVWIQTIITVFYMVLGAITPAISHAFQSKDWKWIDTTNRKLWYGIALSGIVGIFLAMLLGPLLLNKLYTARFEVTSVDCLFLALALLSNIFMAWFAALCTSIGMFRQNSMGGIIQGIVALLVFYPASQFNGFITIGICIVCADSARAIYTYLHFLKRRNLEMHDLASPT
ncbi:MAG: hypothetical protein KF836_05435 [Fimbriimonadaceae bacterium]|nr:hypothetical protein [Fimbriimonadaceae bacterium]